MLGGISDRSSRQYHNKMMCSGSKSGERVTYAHMVTRGRSLPKLLVTCHASEVTSPMGSPEMGRRRAQIPRIVVEPVISLSIVSSIVSSKV